MDFSHSLIVDKAIEKAVHLHAGQTRKHDGKTPFIVHPIGVAIILAQYTNDENILAAAILHDTIEDTAYTEEELRADFGDTIADIVLEVTEPPRTEATWEERKHAYLRRIKTSSSSANMISCADKINNLSSMISDYKANGEAMWKNFNEKSFWFYTEVFKALREKNSVGRLINKFETTLNEAEKTFNKKP